MATIQEVAKLAGVAPITVSRVINHSGYFSQEVRERVEAAIAELDYVPNTLARSLRSKRTDTLALLLSDITNPFFTTLARGVEDAASDAGFTVIFCNTDESEAEEQKYLRMLLQKQVDGILLVPAHSSLESIHLITRNHTPLVVLDRAVPDEAVDEVRCDSEAGAYQLIRLLLSLGHHHIAVLSGPRGVSTAEDRVAGYRRALGEAGLPVSDDLVLYGDFTQQSGEEMTRRVLALDPRPTALFAANNFITIGAMKALQSSGLRVPEDLALVGFDDLPPALVTFPFFTVVSQPAYEMGRQATRLLLNRLAAQQQPEAKQSLPKMGRKIVLPTEVIIRRSSGGQIAP